jgi:integrase/recombinase XerD
MRTGSRPYTYKPDPRKRYAASEHAGAPGDRYGLMAAMYRYLEHRAMLGSTQQGLWNQERWLRDFIAWADERGVTHPSQVTRPVIERYQRWLYHYRKRDGSPLSIAGQRCKLVPLRGFFRWLTRVAEIPANPAADMELPRKIKRLPRVVLTAEEAERVMACVDLGTPIGLRDRAMLEVLYATGVRRHELAALELGDIEAERGVVLIREGKGRKDRMVPIGERALGWVARYLEEVRPLLCVPPDEGVLFLSEHGERLELNKLTFLMAGYISRARLGKKGACHVFRHTMAMLMLEGGADVRVIQEILGHSQLTTTQLYTRLSIAHLKTVYDVAHPAAKLAPPPRAHADAVAGAEATPTADELLAALEAEARDEDTPRSTE